MKKRDALSAAIRHAYTDAIARGDQRKAREILDTGLAGGLRLPFLYLRVLAPAQRQLTEMRDADGIAVVDKNLALQITLDEMTRLRQEAKRAPSLEVRCAVAPLNGEFDILDARIVSDFLYIDGWEVDFLGVYRTPIELTNSLRLQDIRLLVLCTTTQGSTTETHSIIKEVRTSFPLLKILITDPQCSSNKASLTAAGVHAVAEDAKQSLREARRLVGIENGEQGLSQYLKGLGTRITNHRKSQKLSQQDIADISGLDRAYISSLENGKQNVTVGAVGKIARALDLPLEDLLVG
jgi:methanogenic corrinoid protein MtbC1/DNA-binding XRE family transcriptional regulator